MGTYRLRTFHPSNLKEPISGLIVVNDKKDEMYKFPAQDHVKQNDCSKTNYTYTTIDRLKTLKYSLTIKENKTNKEKEGNNRRRIPALVTNAANNQLISWR